MRDSIILYSPLNFVFTHTSPLVNKTNHIIEISGKKFHTCCLIIPVLIMVGVKKVHKRSGETYHLNVKGFS